MLNHCEIDQFSHMAVCLAFQWTPGTKALNRKQFLNKPSKLTNTLFNFASLLYVAKIIK